MGWALPPKNFSTDDLFVPWHQKAGARDSVPLLDVTGEMDRRTWTTMSVFDTYAGIILMQHAFETGGWPALLWHGGS